MLVHHVLEVRGEVDFARADARERVEGLGRQRRRAVLDGAGEPVVLARDARELGERLQIDLHVHAQRAVGVDEAAVRRPRLHADLAQPDEAAALVLQRRVVAVHIGVQLVDVGVLAAHLADLAADRHRDVLRLLLADERREVGGQLDVDLLLLGERRLREVHQRRRVDVDVVEAGGDLLFDQRAQPVDLLVALGAVELLRVGLDVIALDEDRAGEALAQRGAEDDRRVLVRPLLRVADLRPRDLEDERAGARRLRRSHDRARRVVRHRAHVDRGDGEAGRRPFAHRHVEIVNRRRANAGRGGEAAQDPARRAFQLRVAAEHRCPYEPIDHIAGDGGGARDAHAVGEHSGRRLDGVGHLLDGLKDQRRCHDGSPRLRATAYSSTGKRKSSTAAAPSAAAIMSSIGSACSAASTSGSRARVAGCFGVKSVQQS